jgi:hypothetical protein
MRILLHRHGRSPSFSELQCLACRGGAGCICYIVLVHGRSWVFLVHGSAIRTFKTFTTPTNNSTFQNVSPLFTISPPHMAITYISHPSKIAMTSRPPPTPHIGLHPNRSRSSSDVLSVRSPQLLHHSRTGRIERARSTSSRLLSIRNQEAIWETATGRSWAHADELLDPESSLPEFITPSRLSGSDIYTAASSPPSLPPLQALPPLEEESSLVEPLSTVSGAEVNTQSLP